MARDKRSIDDICKEHDVEWFNTALDLAKNGASIAEICVAIGIARNTLYYKMKRHDEDGNIKELVDGWKLIAEAWHQKKLRVNLENKDFSYQGAGMIMKNRFNWNDGKQQLDITSGDEAISLPVISWVSNEKKED